MTISAAIIAQDAERHIRACLVCLRFADEIVVVDGGSLDRTAENARALGARVLVRPFDNYALQRQFALENSHSDWVFFVDHDERVSAGLAAEIRTVIARDGPDSPVGYWVPRRNYIAGRWTRGGGWSPDRQLRLVRRDRSRYDLDRPVHELVHLDGRDGVLACAIVHYNYDDYGQFLCKQARYALLEAERRRSTGETPSARRLITSPLREGWRRLVIEGGARDGIHGVWLALGMAWYAFQVEARIRAYSVRVSSARRS